MPCCPAVLSLSTFAAVVTAVALTDCAPAGLNLLPRTMSGVASPD